MYNLPDTCTASKVDAFFASDAEMADRGEVLADMESIGFCKDELAAIITKYAGLLQANFKDTAHAKACINEVVDDLFAELISQAKEVL